MKLKCIVCALLAASVFFSSFGFADSVDHNSGPLNDKRRSTQDEKITETTAAFAAKYFSYESSEDAQQKDFKTRYETEKFEGKTIVQALNGVKKFTDAAINARKEPTEAAIDKERPIAKAIADMLFVVDQKGLDEAGDVLVKAVEGYRKESGSDTQTEEFQKRLLVAMQNFNPIGKSKKEVEPQNEEMNAFYAAWKEERTKVEKELAAQLKLRDQALNNNNQNARDRLLSGDQAVGADFAKKLDRMIRNGHTDEAKKWVKALAPDGRLAFNNGKGEPVFMDTNGLSDEAFKKTFADEKMQAAKFVGKPHPDTAGAKDWIWTKNGIDVRPPVSPQTAGNPALGSQAKGAGGQVAQARGGAALFQANCVGCHKDGGALTAQGAEKVRNGDMPKSSALSQRLTSEDRETIAKWIESQVTNGQVAAR